MIQLLLNSGIVVLQYGLRNSFFVVVILIAEVVVILLGIVFGVLARHNIKGYICLSTPGVVGCLLFVFINTLGGKLLSDAHIWLPPLAEDLVVFTVISYIALYFKKRIKQKKE